MRRLAALALAACAACTQAPASTPAACTLPAPTILQSSGDPHAANGRLLQVWDVPDAPVLWSETSPTDGGYPDFIAQVRQRGIETDPVKLLNASPTPNNVLVAANAAAWIHPAGCLEKLMIGLQHTRLDTFTSPTEFATIVMRSPDRARLHIYFFTINQDGIGRASPITDPAMADAAKGWTMELALHPHVFHPGKPELDGLVSPSVPDAGLNYNLAADGLSQAWITNGVSTVRIPASEFARFQREQT